MRPIVLTLVVALLAAGCVTKGDAFPGSTVSTDADGDGASSGLDPAAEEPQASTPAPEAEDAEGNASEAPADAPSTNQSAQPQEPEAEPEPPVPQPRPWSLNATFVLGWAQALAAPDGTQVHGATAEGYCPDAGFVVPAGAKALRVSAEGAAVNDSGPGAGVLVIDLTHPDGTVTSFSPLSPDPAITAREFATEYPAAAAWGLHARAMGPAVNQAYVVSVVVEGESVDAPAFEVAAPGCA